MLVYNISMITEFYDITSRTNVTSVEINTKKTTYVKSFCINFNSCFYLCGTNNHTPINITQKA